tara:strand:+ start:196 stop:405 length:210 start_codon:yes stop_codon:yes gene_type:complete
MNIKDVLKIQEVVSKRKIPYDVLDEESVYHSQSKDIDIPIIYMDIVYLIRSFKKILRLYLQQQAEYRGK